MAKAEAGKAKTAAKAAKEPDDHLPSPEEAGEAFAAALGPRQERARGILHRLQAEPPQVMIMEGGSMEERTAMALWYAALHSCHASTAPCLVCQDCLRVGANMHADVAVLDGRAGNIGIDAVREMRGTLSEAPRGEGRRVVLLLEAQALGVEAANALLKSLEEPRDRLCFALLAPQRERLLPTLVSRGWVLTLAWPKYSAEVPAAMRSWVMALDQFLSTGQGLFAQTSVKGALDADTARQLLVCLQKSLAAVMAAPAARPDPLAGHLALLPPAGQAYATDLIAQAQTSLDFAVNPALVIDWLCVRLYHAVKRFRKPVQRGQ